MKKRSVPRPNRAHQPPRQHTAGLQPDQGIFGKAKPLLEEEKPQVKPAKRQIAPVDRTGTINNRVHSVRPEALARVGLPDIGPPPITPPASQRIAEKLAKMAEDETLDTARVQSEMRQDANRAALNQHSQISGALSMQPKYEGRLEDHNTDELIQLMETGYLKVEIARFWNVSPTGLLGWISRDPSRSARAQEACEAAAQAWDAKALEILRTAPKDDGRARQIASYLQWRAERLSMAYKHKQELNVSGGLLLSHEAPDRAPITELIGEVLKPFAPAPRLIEVQVEEAADNTKE